jgi:peptidyl-prolyl cis-trans isomerase B (cyclophilin B)
VAGSAAVLAAVVVLALLGGRPAPRAAPGPAREEEVHLPSGCTSERPRRDARPLPRRAPHLVLEAGRDYRAVVHTSCGDISIDLLEGRAPRNVANFVGLARRGFYDGLTWHRVEADVVVQSGDPNGRNLAPPDGPPYEVPDEIAGVRGRDYVYGVVGMANAGPDTAGSQFFIVVHDHDGALERDPEPAGLQPDYTIFGRVDRSSWPALERLASVPVRGGLDLVKAVEPVIPVYIESIDVGGSR